MMRMDVTEEEERKEKHEEERREGEKRSKIDCRI